MIKKNNLKHFNYYVLLSTFGRNLVELFIGILLYKAGFNIKNVLLFYILIYGFCITFLYPFIIISKKVSHKIVSIISTVSFGLLLILLINIKLSLLYLFIYAFLYSLYRLGYWLSRRYYNFRVIKKTNIGKYSSFVSIYDQFAKIIAIYIGAICLDKINYEILFIVAGLIYLFSLLPLCNLDFEHDKNSINIDIKKTIKNFGFGNMYLIGSYELIRFVQFLIPLYLYIYIQQNFQIVGILSVYTNLAVLIFAYLYGKQVDKSRNLLKLSIFLSVLAFILKLNVAGMALVLVSLMEGIVTKMYDVSMAKEVNEFSKKFEYNNYNLVYELSTIIIRLFIGLILYLFTNDVKIMIYIVLFFMLIGIFIPFKKKSLKDFVWKN